MKRKLTPVWIVLWAVVICLAAGHGTALAAKKDVRTAKTPQVAAGSHMQRGIACANCHGKSVPAADAEVENQRCLACHGPLEKLVKNSTPKDFPDRNPHKSHLGDIACTVCHHEHSPSKVYCLDCHARFDMKLPNKTKKQ